MKKPWTRSNSLHEQMARQKGGSDRTQSPSHDEIARRAYELFVNRGCTQGQDRQDWMQAERELRASTAVALSPKPSAAATGLRADSKDAAKASAKTIPTAGCGKNGTGDGLNTV